MPYYDGRWHLYSEQERREYGERKRAELSKKWHAKWISRQGLKDRLWTDKAIQDFLGKPRAAGAIKAWLRKDVLRAERGPEFQTWMEKRRRWLAARGKLPAPYPLPDNVFPIRPM
jgi:hypothetical protein